MAKVPASAREGDVHHSSGGSSDKSTPNSYVCSPIFVLMERIERLNEFAVSRGWRAGKIVVQRYSNNEIVKRKEEDPEVMRQDGILDHRAAASLQYRLGGANLLRLLPYGAATGFIVGWDLGAEGATPTSKIGRVCFKGILGSILGVAGLVYDAIKPLWIGPKAIGHLVSGAYHSTRSWIAP